MALTIDFTNSNVATNTSVNAISYTTGATGTGTGGLIANVTTLFIGNNTINTFLTTTGLSINAVTIANTTGVYTTGTVNAASHTVGSIFIANTTQVNTSVNTFLTSTTTSGNAVSGALIVSGGVGVANNIYVAGRVGFSNSINVSVVYQYYNVSTNSLDTVFG